VGGNALVLEPVSLVELWAVIYDMRTENEEMETVEASIDREAKEGEEGIEKMSLEEHETQLRKLVTQ
jgi:hypothetical protein